MRVVLHKGSWREFKIVLLRKGYADSWDSNISRKIFMILQGEEVQKRFLSAFPRLSKDEKLDLSLDDIINPIKILEEKSHRMGCHPGRLTLDPERYNRAWFDNRNGDPGYGYPRGETPPHMMAGFLYAPTTGKHRLLDVSEEIDYPRRRDLASDFYQQRDLPWGLQDMYFLGGLPLEYWCNGDSMGMAVRWSPPCSENFQWLGTAFRAQTDEEAGEGGDHSHVTECCRTYCFSRMFYLPCEKAWWARGGGAQQRGEFIEIYERRQRTWLGNEWWITGQAEMSGDDRGGQELGHNVYIKYIQEIEDFDEAAKCEGEEIQGLQFDEYCSWISQCSDSPQCITIGGYV
jgi:hypothetical protein